MRVVRSGAAHQANAPTRMHAPFACQVPGGTSRRAWCAEVALARWARWSGAVGSVQESARRPRRGRAQRALAHRPRPSSSNGCRPCKRAPPVLRRCCLCRYRCDPPQRPAGGAERPAAPKAWRLRQMWRTQRLGPSLRPPPEGARRVAQQALACPLRCCGTARPYRQMLPAKATPAAQGTASKTGSSATAWADYSTGTAAGGRPHSRPRKACALPASALGRARQPHRGAAGPKSVRHAHQAAPGPGPVPADQAGAAR